MADVLRQHGYHIDRISPSLHYAGMEVDIEGNHSVMGTPLYAECKYYENEVDAPKFQAFFGRYGYARHGRGSPIPIPNAHVRLRRDGGGPGEILRVDDLRGGQIRPWRRLQGPYNRN